MKATKITYSRLQSLGDYNNHKIEIELQIDSGERAKDVLKAAKEFVVRELGVLNNNSDYMEAMRILNEKEFQTYARVIWAEGIVANHQPEEELPF